MESTGETEIITGLMLPEDMPHACYLVTNGYLAQIDPEDPPEPEEIASCVTGMLKREILEYNRNTEPGMKWRIPNAMPWYVIARVMLYLHKIRVISFSDMDTKREQDLLAIYQDCGKDKGLYVPDPAALKRLIERYNPSLKQSEENSLIERLRANAKRVKTCDDPDLIALNNCIFNFKTKRAEPFDPDIVFLAKSRVDYNPLAQNVSIHNDADGTDWDICSWIEDLFDDPEIPELIWQILGAVLRPNVCWRKAAFLYATSGNNGKGCLCQLMRSLAGKGTHASIPLSDFGKDFMLEQLIGINAIITDENDVGDYLEKCANLKAVITNDVIQVNRKNKSVITYRFRGFMVQCVNQLPSVKDRSDSLYRRILFIPFDKCYTGAERRYIKDDYLQRQDVLEYVLYRVMHMDYYELKEPASCKQELEEYKIYNDSIREFTQELLTRFIWDGIPAEFIYLLYQCWMKKNNPNGKVLKRTKLLAEVRQIVGSGMHGWTYYKKPKSVPKDARWGDNSDPMLREFGISNEQCEKYKPNLTIRGLLRDVPNGDPSKKKSCIPDNISEFTYIVTD